MGSRQWGRGMDPDDRSELLEQALKCLRVPDDRREDASAWVVDAAQLFRDRHTTDQQAAPRLATLKKQTGAIEEHAAELAHLLDESDPYFAWAAVGYLPVDKWRDDQGDPHISEIADPQERTQLTAKLQRLASLAKHLHEALPKDTGGQHNLQGIFKAPSTWLLAVDCWELFDWFRPGKATGHIDGDYHAFVEIVYEIAIQEKPNAGLTAFTKQAAPRCKTYAERTPAYRHLRRAGAPGQSPVGVLTTSGLAAALYGVPAELLGGMATRKRHR